MPVSLLRHLFFALRAQLLRGVPHSRAFRPASARPGKPQRCHIHLLLNGRNRLPAPSASAQDATMGTDSALHWT